MKTKTHFYSGLSVFFLFLLTLPQSSFGFGEIVYAPSYAFNSQKFDPTHVGLYVQEELGSNWFYSSWSGIGRVFQGSSSSENITWYTTQHEVNFRFGRISTGGGFGYSYTSPSSHSEPDVHLRLSARLW